MEKVLEYIKSNNMIKSGEIVGVACSGGRDSICLLHYLNSLKSDLDFEVVAVNVDHGIRPNSALDTEFVMDFCKKNGIRAYKFKGEALKVAKEEGLTVEQAARKVRYGVFETLINKGLVDKIALAHHLNDQAETVILNILRGCGLKGARGMEPVRDYIYIRPFLNTPREEIMAYLDEHNLEYVEDETNQDNTYSRNYVRNIIMPAFRKHFKSVDKNIVNFASICAKDDDFISSQVNMDAILYDKNVVRVPLSYFYQNDSIVVRMLMKVFSRFVKQDIESKHIKMVQQFAIEARNGNVISLPNKLKVMKEYDYIAIGKIKKKDTVSNYPFRSGKLRIDGYGTIRSTSSKILTEPKDHQHIVDADRIPTTAEWRFRRDGDMFSPLGLNGTKKLNDYFIDKKVPKRLRDQIPVLAVDNKILVVADIEIADEIKVTDDTIHFYKINYEKDLL